MKFINNYIIFTAVGFLAILSACHSDSPGEFNGKPGDEIIFKAAVRNIGSVETRTPPDDSTTYVALDYYDTDFFIRLSTIVDGEPVIDYGTYTVASTYEGRLAPTGVAEPLNWKSLRGKHTFYGWTFPSGGYLDYGDNVFEGIDNWTADTEVPNPTMVFKNSEPGEKTGYDKYKNNNIYETFIGVKKADVSYIPDGTYVPLIFRHLVSKIYVQELILNQSGSIQEHLKATITFYNMPNEAVFYPLGKDDIKEPVVIVEKETNVYDKLTFYIDNNENHEDYFYIPPEIDFSKVSFSVSLTSTEEQYNEMKEYSGTISDVRFERKGTNWDNASGEDFTTLHAGEMMIVRIILYPGGGGGLFIRIIPWSTHEPETSSHYSRQGIYTDNALNELAAAADNSDAAANLFELYGQTETVDGKEEKVFNLYENANLTSKNGNTSVLRVPNNYILDGNGHLITATNSSVQVRNVRNVYITDGKGNYVFIDADGNIFRLDPSTFEPIGDPIGTMTPNKSSTINFSNWTVT